jgi:GT2 family glycosyltransferase
MLFVVIPVFNRWSFTKDCLKSLTLQSNDLFKIIVVDHGSTDGTSDKVALQFPDVILLKGDKSMWWTAATNLGLRYALNNDASSILTLNNDTIADPDYVAEIFKAADKAPANALIGSTFIDVNTKEVTYRGEIVNWLLQTNSENIWLKAEPKDGLVPVTHFPGRGLLIPREVFEKIGLFDEKHFPHYMADYEFTLRAAKKGFPLFCAWNAKIGTYPEASGAKQLKQAKSLRAYKEHLFGIKGGANLPLFYKFAIRHCPVYALPSYLFLGTARRLIGYWL